MIRRTQLITLFFIALTVSVYPYGSSPPAWLRTAASVNVPAYDKDVPAVVLHDEEEITVDKDGSIVTVERYAIKVITREGRELAVARAFYFSSAGKIGELEAWIISPDGKTKDYGKKQTMDMIADPDDVYNEGRLKIIDVSAEINVGDVFGFTVEKKDPPLFYQDMWQFQGRLPVITSRYVLNLPQNWTATSITFNHDDVKPTVNGSTYIWQLNQLPPIPAEPLSPSIKNLSPFIAVNFTPPAGNQASNRSFTSWQDVSVWATGLYDPQVIVNDEVAAKARELTANAKTELDKIKAIGKYVQDLQYISIDIGVAYGNGYKPRPSSTVLSRGYGDCKDKATLMRAMLQSLKISAYPVAIYAGDPDFVRKEWASPRQFNHCIIAIVVGADTESATIIQDSKLGRLLIFDATDDMTPVGDLPDYLQGSYGLVMAGTNGDLIKMPMTDPSENALVRTVDVKLAEDGSISGSIKELTRGQSSKYERSLYRSSSAGEYQKSIEGWLTRGATAAKLLDMKPSDDHENSSFDLNVSFSAPAYGQLMQGRLLVFRPTIVSRSRSIYLTEKERKLPVTLDSNSFNETAVFELPTGFSVDEMPDSISLETGFGSYSTSYEVKDRKLFFTRKLVMERKTIPVSDYGNVRDFFTKILNAENAPVVLIKQ